MFAAVLSVVAASMALVAWYLGGTDALLGVVLLVVVTAATLVVNAVAQSERRLRSELRAEIQRASNSTRAIAAPLQGTIDQADARLQGRMNKLERQVERASHHLLRRIEKSDKYLRTQITQSISQTGKTVVSEVEARVQRPGAQAEALLRAIKAGYARVELEQGRQQRSLDRTNRTLARQFKHLPAEIDALLQLHRRTELDDPLPLVGGWALSPRGLLQAMDLVAHPSVSLVVECGSGTSTLFLARVLQQKGFGRLIALEHLLEYQERTYRELKQHGLDEVAEIHHAPLTEVDIDGTQFMWYSTSSLEDVKDIDVLLVDGPPGSTGAMARFPAYPLLREKLASSALILVDDVHRDDEMSAVDMWVELGGLSKLPTYGRDQALLQCVT